MVLCFVLVFDVLYGKKAHILRTVGTTLRHAVFPGENLRGTAAYRQPDDRTFQAGAGSKLLRDPSMRRGLCLFSKKREDKRKKKIAFYYNV